MKAPVIEKPFAPPSKMTISSAPFDPLIGPFVLPAIETDPVLTTKYFPAGIVKLEPLKEVTGSISGLESTRKPEKLLGVLDVVW